MNPIHAQNTRRWMLVDDDRDILDFMKEIIAQFGSIDTECFRSPYDALAAFTADPKAFELVITDLQMPGMDGIKLCHRLLELRPDAKIMLLTGSNSVTEESVISEGFSGLLRKPFPFSDIRRLLGDMGVTQISHPE